MSKSWKERVFPLGIPLAWRQLVSEPKRFAAALSGITFAVAMMLFQMSLYDALFTTVVRPHQTMNEDLFMISKTYAALADSGKFTRRRLYQVLGDESVDSVASVYIGRAMWRNPVTLELREIFIMGCRAGENAFSHPCLESHPEVLKAADEVFYDEHSRPEYGPIAERFKQNGVVETEAEGLRLRVKGLFEMGATFAADGNLLVGDMAFFRLAGYFPKEMISIGLIRLKPGQPAESTARRLQKLLPNDVRVVTRDEFLAIDRAYWAERTPIGFVISASMVVGMIVGAVIIYQILYADVSDHLPEYATLKGIGFSDGFFFNLILQQSLILSVCGFFPGIIMSYGLCKLTQKMAFLPTVLTPGRLAIVFVLAVGMCGIGGALASRKLKSASPADLF